MWTATSWNCSPPAPTLLRVAAARSSSVSVSCASPNRGGREYEDCRAEPRIAGLPAKGIRTSGRETTEFPCRSGSPACDRARAQRTCWRASNGLETVACVEIEHDRKSDSCVTSKKGHERRGLDRPGTPSQCYSDSSCERRPRCPASTSGSVLRARAIVSGEKPQRDGPTTAGRLRATASAQG